MTGMGPVADWQLLAFEPRKCDNWKSALDPLERNCLIVMPAGVEASAGSS